MDDGNQENVMVMPSSISKAIVGVIKALGTLSKEQTNDFDRYEYASIDDFIKFVRGDAAQSGLFFIPQEAREPELRELQTKKGTPLMMWCSRFGFIIGHEDGSLYGPIYKTVMVQASGAQAAGSAQSYALKQLMRALFLIPTGDKDDPDKMENAEFSAKQEQTNILQQEAQRIKRALDAADTEKKVRGVWGGNSITLGDIKVKSETGFKFLEDLMLEKLKSFSTEINKG